MTPTQKQVPYIDRHIITKSGFALIWPFTNIEKGNGPYELFLDNNALFHTQWLDELPVEFKSKSIINPLQAFFEQWISNPDFKADPINRIKNFILPFQNHGFLFPSGYAENQTALLQANEDQIKSQWSLPFAYTAILKKLLDDKRGQDYAIDQIRKLSSADVPRFSACLLLGLLSLYLKGKQSLKLHGDSKPAISYLESFFAYQPEKKGEALYVSHTYLRNRSGDLGIWYLLPYLVQQRFSHAGEPIVVTRDKALHRVIFKVLPPAVHPSGTVAFAPDFASFDAPPAEEFRDLVMSVPAPFTPPANANERLRRMHNLFEFAKSCCTQSEEISELDVAWSEWFQPGHDKEILISA